MQSKKKVSRIFEEKPKPDEDYLQKRGGESMLKRSSWDIPPQPSLKLTKASPDRSKVKISIARIKTLIRNPKQFMWIYGVELGYHYRLPPRSYITWPYIIAIIKGEKKMMKAKDIFISVKVPKLEQLSMKRVWPKFRKDSSVNMYMPLSHPERIPPRTYFYEILYSKFKRKFDDLIDEAKNERLEELQQSNLVINAEASILEEIQRCSIWTDMSRSQISKRVTPTPVRRQRK